MANWLTYQNYATVGTEAAALALWCLVTSWKEPRQAVSMAVSFGGSAPVTACMTGGRG
jgi:ADP-ribosylglycohydrolase